MKNKKYEQNDLQITDQKKIVKLAISLLRHDQQWRVIFV